MTRPNSGDAGRRLRPIGFLTAIPFILLFGPLIGYLFGHWLDGRWGTDPYLMVVFIVLGFVAAGKEVWSLIQKASRDTESKDN